MKYFHLLPICLLVLSCNAPKAVYDYDQQANFSSFQTYNIYPELNTGLNQLDEKRLLSSLKKALQEANLSLSENPDLYLNIYTEEYKEPSRNSIGVGVGGGGGNVGVGLGGGFPIGDPTTVLQLTFDMVNAKTDSLVWQAVVESPFDFNAEPEERQNQFDRIVKKALERYPPKK